MKTNKLVEAATGQISYRRLETRQLSDVQAFLTQNSSELEMAELSVRRSAGEYIAEIRSTHEPSIS